MRNLDVKCDNCGAAKPPRPQPAKTWWSLEDLGEVARTGPLDFCSLPCVKDFIDDADVRRIFAMDFVLPAGKEGAINVPLRYRVVRVCRRLRILRWIVQLLIVKVS
jgi:hypothetical protein